MHVAGAFLDRRQKQSVNQFDYRALGILTQFVEGDGLLSTFFGFHHLEDAKFLGHAAQHLRGTLAALQNLGNRLGTAYRQLH